MPFFALRYNLLVTSTTGARRTTTHHRMPKRYSQFEAMYEALEGLRRDCLDLRSGARSLGVSCEADQS